jgi:hypothetical protein
MVTIDIVHLLHLSGKYRGKRIGLWSNIIIFCFNLSFRDIFQVFLKESSIMVSYE